MTQAARGAGSSGQLNYSRGLYYFESGAVPPAAPFAGLLIGSVVAIVGGIVYGYADHYIPLIYIVALVTLAFAALIGWATARVMVGLKVRNIAAVTIFTLITTAVGYYAAWVGWLSALIGETHAQLSMIDLAIRPVGMWRLILKVNEVGAWSMSHGDPVTGIPLWIVWVCEAAMIFGTSIAVARSISRKLPFCETCGKWTNGPKTLTSTKVMDPADLKQRLESHQLDFVSQLPIYGGTDAQYFDWNTYRCEGCNNFNTLSVVLTQVKRDKRGRTTRTKKTIIDNLLVSLPELEQVKTRPGVVVPAPPGGPVAAGPMPAAPMPAPTQFSAPVATPPLVAPAPQVAAPPLASPQAKSEPPPPPPHDGKLLDL
jgi:hypothetical protein